jgi:two-component system, sensor histidine kinase and response regulator
VAKETRSTLLLVVDDTSSNIDVLLGVLSDEYSVRVATDGEAALRAVAKKLPDLILLDVMMPGMDGFEVCRRLKADEATRDVPIILLTALNRDEDQSRGLEVGAIDYITKPFNPDLVKARIRNHVKLRRTQVTVAAQRAKIEEDYLRLRDLEQSRDELVHLIVHDMRSLILAVNGNLQLALRELEDRQEPQIRHWLSMARAAVTRLSAMTTSLLDASQLESGEMPICLRECDIVALAQSVVGNLEGVARAHERRLEVDLPEAPALVHCDADLVQRVVQNMVSNAIKHSPKGDVVAIAVRRDGNGVRVSVTDNGPGIAPEQQETIFQKFGQVGDESLTRKYTSGLGLYFCKLAVEAHGGRIWVESEVGQGSTFVVFLPGSTA